MIPTRPLHFSAAVLVALLFLTGCQHSSSVRSVTEADNGSTILLSHHDRLEVLLPGNRSTGYAWQTTKLNSWVVAPLGRPSYKLDSRGSTNAALVGSGGTVRLTYEAVGKGASPLELTYSRPWEPETSTNQTFNLTINVTE